MASPYWPLANLRLRTAHLVLRWPASEDLDALAGLAADGVHDPGVQPFAVPWTDAPPAERAARVVQYHWRTWGSWSPQDWSLELVVVRDGEVQGLSGRDFAERREVSTGSWIGQRHQGQGIGTKMRAIVLHLAFAGLGAEYAASAAFEDNAARLPCRASSATPMTESTGSWSCHDRGDFAASHGPEVSVITAGLPGCGRSRQGSIATCSL